MSVSGITHPRCTSHVETISAGLVTGKLDFGCGVCSHVFEHNSVHQSQPNRIRTHSIDVLGKSNVLHWVKAPLEECSCTHCKN